MSFLQHGTIAIMKDGEIVQIGTPEEIVTQPADKYVADFVAGISKMKLVFAHTVMQSVDAYEAGANTLPPVADCPTAYPEDDLDTLVVLVVDQANPIVIQDDGQTVWVVTKDALLHAIKGEGSTMTSQTDTPFTELT